MATRRKNPTKKPSEGANRLLRNGILPGNPGNSGGKPGRSGRPTNAFKRFCRELSASPEYQHALTVAATNPDHENYIGAAKLVANIAVPKTTKKKHSGTVTVRVVRKRQSFNGAHADN